MGESSKLRYLHTKERQEVDFALVTDDQIEVIIEAKLSNSTISNGIKYFQKKYGYPALQIVKNLRTQKTEDGIRIVRAQDYLSDLDL